MNIGLKAAIIKHCYMMDEGAKVKNLKVYCLLVCCILFNIISPVNSQKRKYYQVNSDSKDSVVFPDQLEYLESWSSACENKNQIYWPINNMCYEEFTQGPCPVGQIIILDRLKIEPKCEIDNSELRILAS